MLRAGADRFNRMRMIEFLDLDAIHECRCLVVGAGALGNEVVKDLVLSGFRYITLVDHDVISRSNLSRCLFFREKDVGSVKKARAIASRARSIDPDAWVRPNISRIQFVDMSDHDIILGCVDNIDARIHINSHARFLSIPYIDGATHGLRGKVQTVLSDGPCLQCAMNRTHVKQMERHFSCSGDDVFVTPIPSDITTTAVIAGMMVREAMKIVSGRSDLCSRDMCYYDGEKGTTELLDVPVDPTCPNHGGD